MTDQDSWTLIEDREITAFKKKVIKLNSTLFINAWAIAEHVPAAWKTIDIALYHFYDLGFDLVDSRIRIKVTS